jgi:hypothetical protein
MGELGAGVVRGGGGAGAWCWRGPAVRHGCRVRVGATGWRLGPLGGAGGLPGAVQ